MSRVPAVPPVLRAVLETGRAIATRSSSASVALAKVASVLDPDLLPPEIRDRTRAELDEAVAKAVRPLSAKDVEKVLKEAWSTAPGKVLDDLDPEPLAVRAASQVHRAELDGTPVAVKVRRPGLDRAVRADLGLLDALIPPLRAAFPRLDAGALLRAAREMALDELDLEHEAATSRTVGRALRGVEGVTVPRALSEHCAPAVLVTELLEGRPLLPDPPATAGATLLRAHGAAARAGWVLYDPAPEHVLVLGDGTLGLLGTGTAAPLDRARLDAGLAALRALREGDEDAWLAATGTLAILPQDAARRAFAEGRELAAPLLDGPVALDAPLAAGVLTAGARRVEALLPIASAASPAAADVAASRGLGQLAALLARLGQTEDWTRLAEEAAA
jgi:hypothetical protein